MGDIADDMINHMDQDWPREYMQVGPDPTPFYRWRSLFIWTDIYGDKHPLDTIDNIYLNNIINHLIKKKLPLIDKKNREEVKRVSLIIKYLKREQTLRKKLERALCVHPELFNKCENKGHCANTEGCLEYLQPKDNITLSNKLEERKK